MTTTNPTTNWHLSQLPNLTETLRVLSNAGVEIIGIQTKTNDPMRMEIHCWQDEEGHFLEWIRTQEWQFYDRDGDTIYPKEAVTFLNGCKVFALIYQKRLEKWEEGDNA